MSKPVNYEQVAQEVAADSDHWRRLYFEMQDEHDALRAELNAKPSPDEWAWSQQEITSLTKANDALREQVRALAEALEAIRTGVVQLQERKEYNLHTWANIAQPIIDAALAKARAVTGAKEG